MPPAWVYILLASVLVTMFLLTDLLVSRPLPRPTVRTHEVERAYVISLEDRPALAESVARQLHVPNVTLWAAVNASVAEKEAPLPLYARYVLDHGRHDHFQLGSNAALGCLLSHMQVWRDFLRHAPDSVRAVAVFEEDIRVDAYSLEKMNRVWADAEALAPRWSVLKLTADWGHSVVQTGGWQYHSDSLASCATKAGCTTFGTRGYLVTRQGAERLLAHADPITVQVDALISLAASYDPDFALYWALRSIAAPDGGLTSSVPSSTVWDGCLKCYLPTGAAPYILVCLALAALACALCCSRIATASKDA